MLQGWEREQPGRLDRIFAALGNVAPSHLLDRELFDFAGLEGSPPGPPWFKDRSPHAGGEAEVRISPVPAALGRR